MSKKRINIYINLILIIIIITIIILLGIFSCPCCVSGWWCVCPGSRGLLKLSQLAGAGKLVEAGSGVGGGSGVEGGAVLGDVLEKE